jgi:HEAT repeat protein
MKDNDQFFLLLILAILLIVLFGCAPANAQGPLGVDRGPQEITVPLAESTDTLAVQALIEKFDSPDVLIRTDDEGYMMTTVPAFACYAEACAKLDGAVPILRGVLADIHQSSYQRRLGAAIALEAAGPEAVEVLPLLEVMLERPDVRENIMALAIIRGIGPDAASLLSPVRTLLYAENLHVQYWACRAVAAMGDAGEPAVADLCLLLIMDSPASVRRNACIALGEVAPQSENVDIVIRLLAEVLVTDYSHPVQVEAKAALEKIFAYQP